MYTLTQIEDAIIARLKSSSLSSYCSKIEAFQFEGEDEEEEIRLIAKKLPCVLVVYKEASWSPKTGVLDRDMTWWILAAAQSLRSTSDARRKIAGTYQMLDDIRDALKGQKLGLEIRELLPKTEGALVNSKGFSAYYIEFNTMARYQV